MPSSPQLAMFHTGALRLPYPAPPVFSAAQVTFLGPHTLYDLSEDAADELLWRREGEAWEPPASDELAEGGEAAPLTLGEIVQQISAAER